MYTKTDWSFAGLPPLGLAPAGKVHKMEVEGGVFSPTFVMIIFNLSIGLGLELYK